MSGTDGDAGGSYRVLVNDEEQYSLWPATKAIPAGWRAIGPSAAPKAECLAYIEQVWTDLRPLSLRRAMGDAPE